MRILKKIQVFVDAQGNLYEKISPAKAVKCDDAAKHTYGGKPGFYVPVDDLDRVVAEVREQAYAETEESED